ncbi:MAG: PepSY-associated TM helix domain-containing protein, partial [Acidobacteriota bacterium]
MKKLGPLRLTRDSIQRFYDIHSWTGVATGLALFICVWSGSVALFEHDLVTWERPQTRFAAGQTPLGVDALIGRALAHVDSRALDAEADFFVELPHEGSPGMVFRSFQEGETARLHLDPASGAVHESAGDTAFAFLTHLHTDLHLPAPFGRYLVGLLGIVLMVSLISGMLTHSRVVKDIFLLRWRRSRRLTLSDL